MQKMLKYALMLEMIIVFSVFPQERGARTVNSVTSASENLLIHQSATSSSPWIVQSSGVSVELLSIKAVSATVAWVCGVSGVVLRTTNGGTTWSRVDPSNWTGINVSARDANLAWIVAHDSGTVNSALFKTTDGGKTWTQSTSSNDPSTYWQDVRFFDAFNGIIIGNPEKGYFAIYTTTDGGNNWTRVPSTNIPLPATGEMCQSNNMSISGNSAWFSTRSSTTGFPRVFHSTDKGKTWAASKTITGSGSALPSIAFSSETTGLVVGAVGTVLRSTNAGVDWSNPINTGLGVGGSLEFASPSAAVLMNTKGQCAISVDSGLTWIIRPTPDTLAMRCVSFSPSADGWAVGNKGTIWKWAGGNLNNPPLLTSPLDGTSNLVAPVNLTWQAVAGGGTYRLQIALNSAFSSPLIEEDSALTAPSSQLTAIAYNATYYWRVRAENSLGFGPWSSVFSFNTMDTKAISSTAIAFPDAPAASTDYRLVSFPGGASVRVEKFLTGVQKTDWRIFKDNGKVVPNNLVELSATSLLSAGQGYWLVKKGAFTLSTTATMPQLSPDGTFAIDVVSGWNIIGNPFDVPITWDAIKKLNQISTNIWSYLGTGGFQSSATLEAFKGFYFYNGSGVTSLKIPYPFPLLNVLPSPPLAVDWKLQLSLETEFNSDRENFIGVAPSATNGIDELNQPKPPISPDQAFLSLAHAPVDGQQRAYSSDFRPGMGDGQVWNFSVSLPKVSKGKIRIIGVETIPAAYDVVLGGGLLSVPIDLRKTSEISFENAGTILTYSLIVGKKAFVGDKAAQITPAEFELCQNYPNPFNPSTSFELRIASSGLVQLRVFNVLGIEVGTLVDEARPAGVYTVRWDASSLPSGVYFYRLIVDGRVIQTKKMTLLK